jgi:acetylxylan esterase
MQSAFVLSLVVAVPFVVAQCNKVQIFTAVGHGETYPGVQRSITTAVCKGLSSCGVANIQYPSTSSGNGCAAIEQGIAYGRTAITDYVTKCPESKIVVMGWSQVSLSNHSSRMSEATAE